MRPAGIFCARPGTDPELVAASGDKAGDLDAVLAISTPDIVARDNRTGFAASVFQQGLKSAEGVFVHEGGKTRRILTTDARLAAVRNAALTGFLYPLRDAIRLDTVGRTLVHVAISEDRRPDARLGALLLVR